MGRTAKAHASDEGPPFPTPVIPAVSRDPWFSGRLINNEPTRSSRIRSRLEPVLSDAEGAGMTGWGRPRSGSIPLSPTAILDRQEPFRSYAS